MSYRWVSATDVGRMRSGNEDSVFPDPGEGTGSEPLVALVADGMGGAVGGEVASSLAADAASAIEAGVELRVEAANAAVVERVIEEPTLAGMGTTITIGIFKPGGEIEIGHVGDSRAYLISDGRIEQITTDHSLVAELLAAGRIEPEDVPTHPQRHLVTRVLGMSKKIAVDTFTVNIAPGEGVLLCSDGLTGMLSDEEIAEILAESDGLEGSATALIEAANTAGGVDNISLVIVERAE